MKLRLIVNPISGTRSKHYKQRLADAIEARLSQSGFDVDTAFTTARGDATRLARQAVDAGFDGVIACGGDGTVNETARAMIGAPIPMGIIPSGSGNGLARHITIPIDPMAALDVIVARNIVDCDYASVNGKDFFCTFGVGFDAAVSDRFAAAPARGKMTYIKSALYEFRHYSPQTYQLELDGTQIERQAWLIACCNASQYGNNAYIAPHASITDGLLDVIIVKRASRLRTLFLGFDLMSGLIESNDMVEVHRVRHAVITRDAAGSAHLDGEPATFGEKLDVVCHPAALKLFVPSGKTPFRPIITPIDSAFNEIRIKTSHLFHNHKS